ncbi:MAG: class I adenylate-forming enzyme family protein [Rariglobus sp.]
MPEPVTETLLSAWRSTLARNPAAPAVIEHATSRIWTRAELDEAAQAFATRLPAAANRRRVTFALPNSGEWFAAFLGLLHAGATPVPLDPAEPRARQLELAIAARAAFAWINGETCPAAPRPVSPRGAAPVLVKLTSGSSGTPRALPFNDAQMLADGRQVCSSMGIRPEDLNLAVIPFGHSYGLGNLVIPLLEQGTAIVCADTPLPHALATLAARHHPTIFPAVPALLRALAEADLPSDAFASLRTLISAGSPLPAVTARAFFDKYGVKIHGFYGSSETGGIAYDRTGDDTMEGRGIGFAMDGVSISPIRGNRIRVQSTAVSRKGGFIPADRARIESDGRVVLLGRAGRMIKIGGRRLDLGDLENTLRRLPGITDAFAAPHPDDPEQLAAVLATELEAGALRLLLRRELAPWKIPRRLVPVATFPLTARGKPDTSALTKLLER